MYYNRTLSEEETLYISRAQQKIAELTGQLALEHNENTVDEHKYELVLELEYSINILKSTVLNWDYESVRMMMDYYTIKAVLIPFSFRSVSFNPINAIPGGTIWASISQLNELRTESELYDAYLLDLIQQEIDNREEADLNILELITTSNGGVTTIEITAESSLGGVLQNEVFPINTSLQDIINKLLSSPAKIANLTFNSYQPVIEVGTNLAITQFTWDVEGTPENLVLSDSKGLLNSVPVVGSSYSINLGYNWSIPETLTWTLTGDNIEPITISLDRVYCSYYGKEATVDNTPVTINETKIIAGSKYVQQTAEEITVVADTSITEQGFIAVPKNQTVSSYTKWFVNSTNSSNIELGEFILPPVDILVNGIVYEVYRWGYRSPLTSNIKLHR